MRAVIRSLKVSLGAATLTLVIASASTAQCIGPRTYGPTASLLPQAFPAGPARLAAPVPVSYNAPKDTQVASEEPVVGFWSVKFIAKGNAGIPDGTVVDSGYSQWHSDHTEILNSARPPTTQSFCLGVWEKIGASRYRLNHFAISWKPDGTILGPGNIRAEITVSPNRNSFAGTFTIDQYDTKGTVQSHVAGQIEGKRITVNTTVKDIL